MMPKSFILTLSSDSTGTSCIRSAVLPGFPTDGPEKAQAAIGTSSAIRGMPGSPSARSLKTPSSRSQT
jgi:hypothetical protein